MTEPALNMNAGPAPPGPDRLSRTQRLRKSVLDAPYEICIERARYYTRVYRESEGENQDLRAARAFARTLRNMTVYILDDEAVVGNRSSKLVATVIPVERGEINLVLELELERVLRRKDRPFHIADEDKRELVEELLPYWTGKTVRERKRDLWKQNGLYLPLKVDFWTTRDRIRGFGLTTLVNQVKQSGGDRRLMAVARKELPANNPGLCMNVFDVQGHLVVGHKNVIGEGYAGVKAIAEKRLSEITAPDQRAFLEAVVICCDAARDFASRFAELAEQKAGSADPTRAKELKAIAERCRRVPWLPPRDFREAIQFLWFSQVMALISYGVPGVLALGRVDQYLWPYLKADLESEKITESEALELLEELIVKLSYNLLVLPPYGKATGSELGADNQAITIGGIGRGGEDATNPLSYLFVQAAINMRSLTNSISFRVSEKSPDDYVEKVVGLHRFANGPSIFNDEAIAPALAGSGYPLEDARDYAIIGCVEPTSDGNTMGCTSGNDVSLVGCLEMALHRGNLRMLGRRFGPDTGDPKNFRTFDDLLAAYKQQIAHAIEFIARGTELKDRAYAELLPCPFISSTLAGCLENAKDMTRGGAKFNFNSISGRGMATAVDSLLAVKKLVFEEKKVSMAGLLKAIDRNFKRDEKLRQMLLTRPPKFGNNDPAADELARELVEFFCREVMKHRAGRGGIFRPSFFSYGMHVFEGTILGATPDGRKNGEPVSNSLSPVNRAEKNGPVAALASVAQLNHRLIPNGASMNVRLMPSLIATEDGLKKVAAMVRAYFKQGGQQVQFNVVDNETLRKAQQDPESYKDLVVRVSGYSAYFVDLGKPVQDDIIARACFDRV